MVKVWSRVGALAAACTVAVALFVCAEREAQACTCASPIVENPKEGELPIDGPIVVNDLIWEDVSVFLRDEAGASVELVTSEVAVGDVPSFLRFFRPANELVPGATYSFDSSRQWASTEFTTVAALGEPEIPVVKDIHYRKGEAGTCGKYNYAELELENQSGILVVDLDSESSFDPETLSGTVSAVGGVVGRLACSSNWYEAGPGASARARVGVINESGHFSGWSEPFTLKFPSEPSEGCALRAPRNRASGVIALTAVLGLSAVLRVTGRRRKTPQN